MQCTSVKNTVLNNSTVHFIIMVMHMRLEVGHVPLNHHACSLISQLLFPLLDIGIACSSAATVIAALPLDKDTSTTARVSLHP